MSHLDPEAGTLVLVTEPGGAEKPEARMRGGDEQKVRRVLWDNSGVSEYVLAPVVFGTSLTVFLGAAGVHEFTAIETLSDSARREILRRLET
jgi:hypothetical protein